MGFRNRVKTLTVDEVARSTAEQALYVAEDAAARAAEPAAAMDTRGATPRGVVVGADVPKVTLHDGVGTSASWELTTPPGGATGGTITRLRGAASYTAGAVLELNEEAQPAGGYLPVARLTGADRIAPMAAGALTLNATNARHLGGSAGMWEAPQWVRTASGLLHVWGMLELINGSMPLGAQLCRLPAGYWPAKRRITMQIANNNRPVRCDLWPDGWLTYDAAAAADSAFAAGSYLSLSLLLYPPVVAPTA